MTLKSFLSDKENAYKPQVGPDGITLPSLTCKVIKRHIWLLVLASIGFMLNMPVMVALIWSNLPRNYEYRPGYADDIQELFNMGSAAIIGVGAVLAAFTLFRYLHNRNQVDFYHSLPIKREKFFAANVLAGLLIFLLPYLAAHVLALPLLAGSGILVHMDFGQYLLGLGLIIFAYMIMFALATLAMLLSGSLGGAVKILFFTYALCPILSGMLILLGSIFLTNFADMDSLTLVLVRLSVIERLAVLVTNGLPLTVCWQDWVFGGAILLAALVAGRELYKRRDSECAGATLAFGWQKPIFKYPCVVLAGIFGGAMMYTAGDRSVIWLAFGWLFFTVFAAQAMEIFIQRDFRAIRRNLRGAVASLVVAGVVLGAYGLDVFGYEKWRPSTDNVSEIYIQGYNLDGYPYGNSNVWRANDDRNRDDYYSVNPYDYYDYDYAVAVTEPDAVAALVDILNSDAMNYGTYYTDDYGNSYYDYTDYNYARVCFKMKNGGYRVRYMEYGGLLKNYHKYVELYNTEEMRAQMVARALPENLTMEFESLTDYATVDNYYDYDYHVSHVVSAEKTAEFWNVYCNEFAAMSAEQLIKGVPLGELNLQVYKNYRQMSNDDGNTWGEWDNSWWLSVKIYPEMTATIQLLQTYFGDGVFTKATHGGQLVSIVKYTPKQSGLLVAPPDALPLGKDEATVYYGYSGSMYPDDMTTTEVMYTGIGEVTTSSDVELVSADNDYYIGQQVPLSQAAAILANTVTENQLGSVNYYDPWRRTNCLTYYDFKYLVEDGYYVTQSRYVLPADSD